MLSAVDPRTFRLASGEAGKSSSTTTRRKYCDDWSTWFEEDSGPVTGWVCLSRLTLSSFLVNRWSLFRRLFSAIEATTRRTTSATSKMDYSNCLNLSSRFSLRDVSMLSFSNSRPICGDFSFTTTNSCLTKSHEVNRIGCPIFFCGGWMNLSHRAFCAGAMRGIRTVFRGA